MVELMVKLSSKGQVVIPKIFREACKIYPLQEAVIRKEGESIVITRTEENLAQKLRAIAQKVNLRKPLTAKEIKNLIEQQYEERAKRAGILS